ncbi:radical SAM protein [Planctomycetales bacterium]|nr:radical SAM protein [Planctomycetales bacterium]
MNKKIGQSRSALNFAEVAAKYPHFPKLIMLKIDLHRRGVHYTDAALSQVDPNRHQLGGTHIFGTRDGKYIKKEGDVSVRRPEAFVLRDGTSVLTTPTPLELNPYIVDFVDGRLVVKDDGEEMDEIFYWEKPTYYDKYTKSGALMQNVVGSRSQRYYLALNRYCHFWTKNEGCKFCDIVSNLKELSSDFGMSARLNPEDVSETIEEALKEPGRAAAICLTSGSDYRGEQAFDAEIDYYIEILRAIGRHFRTEKFPCQILCTAVKKEQLQRLYDNTGVTSITMDIEVFGEQLFEFICPGKSRWIGYHEWKKRLVDAVDVFGPGRVGTGIVSGVELVPPVGIGYPSEDAALEGTLAEAEDLAKQGVSTVNMIWVPRPGSAFGVQHQNASLEFYVILAWELQQLRKKYNLQIDFDDYRRCGNHADSDLARVFS